MTTVLNKIHPWDDYNVTMVLQQLYAHATKTGFTGTFDDFKLRYGSYVAAAEPQEIYDLIDNYSGSYHITPLVNIIQVLQTKNKVLNEDIIINPIPEELVPDYKKYVGSYQITPLTNVDQSLRTTNKILNQDIVIEKIPYAEVSNNSGGITVTIG